MQSCLLKFLGEFHHCFSGSEGGNRRKCGVFAIFNSEEEKVMFEIMFGVLFKE